MTFMPKTLNIIKLLRMAPFFVLLLFAGFRPVPALAADIDVLDRQRQAPPAPKSQPDLRVVEEAGQPVYDQSLSFTLVSLRVEGSTVFKEQELLAPYTTLYGTQVTFDAVNKIAAELTKKYRDQGYILSRVVLPAQEVEPRQAEVRLVAVEGYLATVEYEGDEKFVERFRSYFSKREKKLLRQRPLRHKDFEREMLLVQDLAGVKAASRFKEGNERGASILVLTVEPKIIDGSLGWGNTGTDSSGPHMFSASLGFSTLPALGAKTVVYYNQAADYREYHSIQIAQSYQFSNGLLLNASYAYSSSPEADTEFSRIFDYQTRSDTFNLGASYPIIRSRDMNLSAGLSFERRDGFSDLLSERYTTDRLRNLTANINFDFADEWGGVTQIIPSITCGLNVFNATDEAWDASNPLASAKYFKFNAYVSRSQQLFSKLSLFTALSAQLSDSLLSSYNQFSLGGSQFGRGYEPGIIQNDNGFAFTIEPRFTHWLTDKAAVQPYIFYDWGNVWSARNIENSPDSETMSSIGAGLRLWGQTEHAYMPDYSVGLYVAQSLHNIRGQDENGRFGMQITFMF